MFTAVRLIPTLAFIVIATGCHHAPTPVSTPPETLAPSARLIVGRIIAIDVAQGFAFVELGADAPAAALADGTGFIARTTELNETARLQASRFVRGRTLGTKIISGKPSPGDEVVWQTP